MKILAFFIVLILGSQALLANCEADLATRRVEKPQLYIAEKDGHQTFILGTHHMGIALSALPGFVSDAIDTSRVVFTESKEPATRIGKLWRGLRLIWKGINKGPKLTSVLSPEALDFLKFRLQSQKLSDISLIDRLSPAMAVLLAQFGDKKSEELKNMPSMDFEIEKRANEKGIKTAGLESFSVQLRAIESIASHKSLNETLLSMKALIQAEKENELLEIYMSGDEQAVRARTETAYASSPEWFQKSVFDRNIAWIPVIEKYHRRHSRQFIAMGAMHLWGDQGVIPLLRQRGYSVKQVTSLEEYEALNR